MLRRRVAPNPSLRVGLVLTVAWILAVGSAAAEGNAREVLRDIERLHAALERHRAETGDLPGDRAGFALAAKLYAPEIAQRGAVPVDAWGTPYHYLPVPDAAGAPYRLYSFGANGQDDGGRGDDLVTAAQADRERYPELLVAQRRALELFPVLLLAVLAPIAWAAIRWSKR